MAIGNVFLVTRVARGFAWCGGHLHQREGGRVYRRNGLSANQDGRRDRGKYGGFNPHRQSHVIYGLGAAKIMILLASGRKVLFR